MRRNVRQRQKFVKRNGTESPKVGECANDQPPLSPHRAFVVQFNAETDLEHRRCMGRVEHVVSGAAIHFQSLEQLLSFVGRLLAAQAGQRSDA